MVNWIRHPFMVVWFLLWDIPEDPNQGVPRSTLVATEWWHSSKISSPICTCPPSTGLLLGDPSSRRNMSLFRVVCIWLSDRLIVCLIFHHQFSSIFLHVHSHHFTSAGMQIAVPFPLSSRHARRLSVGFKIPDSLVPSPEMPPAIPRCT